MIAKMLKSYRVFSNPLNRLYSQSIPSTCHSSSENRVILDKNFQLGLSDESPYYFEDGLRKVYPFYFNHKTFCKGRWIGRTVLDVYSDEFGLYPMEEYVKRISQGSLTVNGDIVDVDYVLENKDVISTIVHRHELPVLACPLKILSEDDHFVVVDKPPSVPVHPCGMYWQNSILRLLANEHGFHNLFVNYRLDRLTSGVLVISKSSEKAREVHDQINLRSVSKQYVCRVAGKFPDTTVICTKPIRQFYNKIGISLVHHLGKICITEFKKLSYNGRSSVVLCKPVTGRTHQIRAHLQYLGHPIVNDPTYNSDVFGPEKGKHGNLGKHINELLEDLLKEHSSEWGYRQHLEVQLKNESFNSVFKQHFCPSHFDPKYEKQESRITYDSNCYFCNMPNRGPTQSRLGLFLHAISYEGNGWKFESEMPFWASESWTES